MCLMPLPVIQAWEYKMRQIISPNTSINKESPKIVKAHRNEFQSIKALLPGNNVSTFNIIFKGNIYHKISLISHHLNIGRYHVSQNTPSNKTTLRKLEDEKTAEKINHSESLIEDQLQVSDYKFLCDHLPYIINECRPEIKKYFCPHNAFSKFQKCSGFLSKFKYIIELCFQLREVNTNLKGFLFEIQCALHLKGEGYLVTGFETEYSKISFDIETDQYLIECKFSYRDIKLEKVKTQALTAHNNNKQFVIFLGKKPNAKQKYNFQSIGLGKMRKLPYT